MINILILSSTASAINYIYSLNTRKDLKIFVTDISWQASGLYSDNITRLLVPPARKSTEYREALDKIIKKYSIDILIPTSDHDIEGVYKLLQSGWLPDVLMFKPNFETYFNFSNKLSLMQKMQSLKFVTPRTYTDLSEVNFPAIIKPAREGGSKGVSKVTSFLELTDRLKMVQSLYGDEVVIQEYIPGDTGSIYVALLLYGTDGKLYGEVASHSQLTFMTWGGGGNAGRLVKEPELLANAKAIVEACGGWQGPINLEFKRHSENNQFYLMEVNCRLNGYSYLSTMNGLNFPAAIVELLTTGSTSFLSFNHEKMHTNFILSYRERNIERWI